VKAMGENGGRRRRRAGSSRKVQVAMRRGIGGGKSPKELCKRTVKVKGVGIKTPLSWVKSKKESPIKSRSSGERPT